MQVRIEFPLSKALLLHLKVKIKGRGIMEIDVKYENFPHLCFSCVRLGHAAQICEGGPELQGIKFGQELRASLPKWVGEISIRQAASRAVQPLFQASLHGSRSGSIGNERKVLHDLREIETSTSFNGAAMHNKGTTN
jgi:hypothetical protein